MKILLIAGHGAGDPGTSGGGMTEATETRLMANAVGAELQKRGVSVRYYPMERNAYADCGKGVFRTTAKPEGYDYVLELHFNAATADKGDGKTKGVECYVTTAESGIGVEKAICLSLAGLGLTNRGVKRKNYDVIKACKNAGVSSALLEVCFLDDADDRRIYTADKQRVACAIADGICEGFGIDYKAAGVSPRPTEGNTMEQKKTTSQPSAWAKSACDKAVKAGIIQGDENGDCKWREPVTTERLMVILDRLGML